MNNSILPQVGRFFILVLFQVLVLKQLSLSVGAYFNIFLYPLIIFLLPLRLSSVYGVLLGFGVGFVIDTFYATPGIHASAGAFSGYLRNFIVRSFGPKGGFSGKEPVFSPSYFSWQSFLQAAGIFLFLHLIFYFLVSDFTFVYFATALLKTLAAWGLTMLFVVIYIAFFKPKE
jgi:hypothetical protein